MESHPEPGPEEASLRSRASSVITTGTKLSFATLPSEERRHVDPLAGEPSYYSAVRGPRSVFSVISHESSLPPYEILEHERIPQETMAAQRIATEQAAQPTEELANPSPTSPVDAENALSMHYGRVVRQIDQNHMNQMRRLREDLEAMKQVHQEELGAVRHACQVELGAMRNATDQAYRKELKAKNREVAKKDEQMASLSAEHEATIARLQREAVEESTEHEATIASLSAEHEATIARVQREAVEASTEQTQAQQATMDKACNAIEDVWEARWNDRIRLAFEETKKMDASYQTTLQDYQIRLQEIMSERKDDLDERDRAWVRALSAKHPELMEELEALSNDLTV